MSGQMANPVQGSRDCIMDGDGDGGDGEEDEEEEDGWKCCAVRTASLSDAMVESEQDDDESSA